MSRTYRKNKHRSNSWSIYYQYDWTEREKALLVSDKNQMLRDTKYWYNLTNRVRRMDERRLSREALIADYRDFWFDDSHSLAFRKRIDWIIW